VIDELKKIEIFGDGRAYLYDLYSKFLLLVEKYGWRKEVIYSINIEGIEVPVYCFISPVKGKALWLMTGIHGEEPSGPNAVYQNVDLIGELGKTIPMVVMPLLNPAGYYRNWRFHNVERSIERLNVTDCRHLVEDSENPGKPMIAKPVHEIAGIFSKYVLDLLKRCPPAVFFDLHEDELLSGGYVYSQGELGGSDPVAAKAVELLISEGLPLKMSGETRFAGEKITNGLVTDLEGKRVCDGSIDEFMGNETYLNGQGEVTAKPYAKTVIVTETPAGKDFSLADRIKGQEAIVKHLGEFWKIAGE
jgi:hypothetical protein